MGKNALLDINIVLLTPDVILNFVRAAEITVDDFARVELARARYLNRAVTFFEEYDLLLSPATVVPPYPVEQRFVAELGDYKFSNYVEWLSIAYAVTITGHLALSVPAGFTKDGLPVGLQIVGGPRGEANLLSAANLYEEISDLKNLVPIIPKKSLT